MGNFDNTHRMRGKRITVITLTLVILFSCIGCGNIRNNRYQEYLKSYSSSLNEYASIFPDSLVSHFPNKTDSIFGFVYTRTTDPDTSLSYKINRLFCCFLLDDNAMNKLENKISDIAIQEIIANDSCALIIHRINHEKLELKEEFYRMIENYENQGYTKKYIDNSKNEIRRLENNCKYFTLPIPNFSSINFNDLILTDGIRLTNEFRLYVLNAEKGKFIESTNLLKDYGLPSDWENGYSKGVAINKKENVAIYWTEVW